MRSEICLARRFHPLAQMLNLFLNETISKVRAYTYSAQQKGHGIMMTQFTLEKLNYLGLG